MVTRLELVERLIDFYSDSSNDFGVDEDGECCYWNNDHARCTIGALLPVDIAKDLRLLLNETRNVTSRGSIKAVFGLLHLVAPNDLSIASEIEKWNTDFLRLEHLKPALLECSESVFSKEQLEEIHTALWELMPTEIGQMTNGEVENRLNFLTELQMLHDTKAVPADSVWHSANKTEFMMNLKARLEDLQVN